MCEQSCIYRVTLPELLDSPVIVQTGKNGMPITYTYGHFNPIAARARPICFAITHVPHSSEPSGNASYCSDDKREETTETCLLARMAQSIDIHVSRRKYS